MNSAVDQLKSIGNDQFKAGNLDEALSSYTEALSILARSRGPTNIETGALLYQNRAACLLKLNRYIECVLDCDKALEIQPASIKALYRRACAYEQLHRIDESKRDALFILQLDPQNKDGITLMRRLTQISHNPGPRGLHGLLDEIISARDITVLVNCMEAIRGYCEEDENKFHSFTKASGLKVIDNVICGIPFDKTDENSTKLLQSCLRLLLSMCQHQAVVKSCITMESGEHDATGSILCGNKLSLFKIAIRGESLINSELQQKLILLVMAILKFTPTLKPQFEDADPDAISEESLLLSRIVVTQLASLFVSALKRSDSRYFQFICDSIGSFISDVPNYNLSNQHYFDAKLETLEQRKSRVRETCAASVRSKCHCMCMIECNSVNVLIANLQSADAVIATNACVCLGKIFKYLNDEGISHSILKQYFPELETGCEGVPKLKSRCSLLHCLLSTQPNLGAWALIEGGGSLQLTELIATGDPALIALASDIACLAAGNEKASSCLQPLIAAGVLNTFLSNTNIGIQAAGAAALAKLAIRAKALHQDSSENGIILNSATHVIRKSPHKTLKDSSIERAIEILASMVSKSYIKDELVFGSSRVLSIIEELCSLEIDERSTASYGLSFIFSNLTVTNWELRALALADKDISVDQYEKMMELQRIKAKDENGDPIEETKDDSDLDTVDNCKARIRKLVKAGGLKLIMRLAEFHSEQTSLSGFRTLRQICVDESSRGLFIQQGGFKLCIETCSNESKTKVIRQEAAHAVAKSLVTTNPHLLSDSLRLSSIRPLLFLCQENDSNDLQRFEALLALTNILSCGSHEQDKFVHEKGLSTVHYLVFSDNLSIRQASVETLCNVSSHQSMGKLLCQDNNMKLWLGLIEEWIEDSDNPRCLKTALAAAGTLAMIGGDLDVALTMCRNDCASTFVGVFRNGQSDMIHRVLVAMIEMLGSPDDSVSCHLKQHDLIEAICELDDIGEIQKGLVVEIGRIFAEDHKIDIPSKI